MKFLKKVKKFIFFKEIKIRYKSRNFETNLFSEIME